MSTDLNNVVLRGINKTLDTIQKNISVMEK